MGAPMRSAIVALDVVVPVFGRPDMLGPCLDSLIATSGQISYRLFLVDDKSPKPDEMEPIYKKFGALPGVTILRNDENLGFPKTVNRGVKDGFAPLVLLLNSDIRLQEGCLQAMMAEFADARTGVVGARLLFPSTDDPTRPSGKLQHAGMYFNLHGEPRHTLIGWRADHPKANKRRDDLQTVTGALLMTRRHLWEKIKGFSEVYGTGTYEDVEYCVQVKHAGFNVVYQPKATALHRVGASAEISPQKGFDLGRNHSIFMVRNSNLIQWDEFLFW